MDTLYIFLTDYLRLKNLRQTEITFLVKNTVSSQDNTSRGIALFMLIKFTYSFSGLWYNVVHLLPCCFTNQQETGIIPDVNLYMVLFLFLINYNTTFH